MEKPTATVIDPRDGSVWNSKSLDPISPIMVPRIMPKNPPMMQMMTDSMINCFLMSPLVAPKAFLIPISLVLSVTDTRRIFITPMPPTKREIAAMAPMATWMDPMAEFICDIWLLAE